MLRYPDWPTRLERYLFAQKGREFRYGVFDCALFVCGAIEAMTGVDPAAEFRGRYAARRKGLSMLERAGGFNGVATAFGMPAIAPLHASRGDILLMSSSPQVLGLMALNGRDALVLTDKGVEWKPLALFPAARAWRV